MAILPVFKGLIIFSKSINNTKQSQAIKVNDTSQTTPIYNTNRKLQTHHKLHSTNCRNPSKQHTAIMLTTIIPTA